MSSGPTSVNEGVFLHVRLLVKTFATVLAWVGPGARMYKLMSGESGGALKHFPTHSAAKSSLLKQQKIYGFSICTICCFSVCE